MKASFLPVLFGLVGSLSLLGAGCGVTPAPTATSQPQIEQPNVEASAPSPSMEPVQPPELTELQKTELKAGEDAHEAATLTFHVTGGNFYFVPNAIKVKKGDTVKIVFENAGGFHNFALDEFNVKIDPFMSGESSKTVEFVADKTGTFEYYCGVGKHRALGQKGSLIVE